MHAPGGDTIPYKYSCVVAGQDGTNDSVFIANTFDIGKKDKGFGYEGYCASHCHLVRVDIVNGAGGISGHTRDYGQVRISGQKIQQPGVRTHGLADLSKIWIEQFGINQACVQSTQSHGSRSRSPEGRDEFRIDAAGEDFQHRIYYFWRRHPQSIHEAAFDATLGEEACHLFSAAVDHSDSVVWLSRCLRYFAGQTLT